ncbi:MAG: cytochrome C oxidase subunit IV family protein [Lutibacter sp.]
MHKSLLIKVWFFLIILTLLSALVGINFPHYKYTIALIIGLTVVKFLGVSFFFMELRKAHSFWKMAIVIYLLLFSTLAIILI